MLNEKGASSAPQSQENPVDSPPASRKPILASYFASITVF